MYKNIDTSRIKNDSENQFDLEHIIEDNKPTYSDDEDCSVSCNILESDSFSSEESEKEIIEENNEGWNLTEKKLLIDFKEPDFDFKINKPCDLVDKNREPYYYFSLFCDDFFFNEIILKPTIKYYEDKVNEDKQTNKRKDLINVENIKRYIGLSTLMGIIRYPEINLYWRKDEIFYNKVFPSSMSRDKYYFINHYIHFSRNNLNSNTNDKLYKIRSVSDYLVSKWIKYKYTTNKYTFDETMISYTGRLSIKQYIPKKPNKYGIKVYTLSNSYNWYITNWHIYTGNIISIPTLVEQMLVSSNTSDCILFCDNYFTSIDLANMLLKYNISITGVIKQNRKKIPKVRGPDRGNVEFYVKDNFTFCIWNDKRIVRVLSNAYTNHVINKKRYNHKKKQTEVFQMPLCIAFYNKYSKGVDNSNNMTSTYLPNRRSNKWYKKIFFYIIECCLLNSYILYKELSNKKFTFLEYKIEIIKELIITKENEVFNNSPPIAKERLKGKHFIERIGNQRRCVLCTMKAKKENKKNNVRSSFGCKTCKVSLCIINCFEMYHTIKDLDKYEFNS